MQNNTAAYLCLGSNKGHSKATFQQVIKLLNDTEGLQIVNASPLYYTEPQGLKDQAWFCNQILRLHCAEPWTAEKLLRFTLHLEEILGRTRTSDMALRFGPRVIDIDLLLFGQDESQEPFCTVPHPRMMERAFVLIPLRHVLGQDTLLTHADIDKALDTLDYRVEEDKIYQ